MYFIDIFSLFRSTEYDISDLFCDTNGVFKAHSFTVLRFKTIISKRLKHLRMYVTTEMETNLTINVSYL